jgi:hypothetical protein
MIDFFLDEPRPLCILLGAEFIGAKLFWILYGRAVHTRRDYAT